MATETKTPKTQKLPINTDAIAAAVTKALSEKKSLKEATAAANDEVVVQAAETVEVFGLKYLVTPMPSVSRIETYLAAQKDESAYGDHLVRMVQESVRDPETRALVWTEAERAQVRALDERLFGPLAAAARRVNVDTQAADDAVGNASGETDTADSSSASPAKSEG